MGLVVSVLNYALSSEEDEQSYVSNNVYETGLSRSDTKTIVVPCSSASSAPTPTSDNKAAGPGVHSQQSDVLHELVSVLNVAQDRAEKLGRSDLVRDLCNQAERRGADLMTYKKLTEGLQRVAEMDENGAKFVFVPLG
jgi:hypothetical protein